jgi:hypothetical protein
MAVDPYRKLRSALLQGLGASPLSLPLAVENAPFEKPADGLPWAMATVLMNQPSVATLGSDGEDAHDGILQVDLNYPMLTGEAAVTAKADQLASFFKAGERLSYQSVELTVLSCGRSRGREVNGYYRVSVTVSWFARVPRN